MDTHSFRSKFRIMIGPNIVAAVSVYSQINNAWTVQYIYAFFSFFYDGSYVALFIAFVPCNQQARCDSLWVSGITSQATDSYFIIMLPVCGCTFHLQHFVTSWVCDFSREVISLTHSVMLTSPIILTLTVVSV